MNQEGSIKLGTEFSALLRIGHCKHFLGLEMQRRILLLAHAVGAVAPESWALTEHRPPRNRGHSVISNRVFPCATASLRDIKSGYKETEPTGLECVTRLI